MSAQESDFLENDTDADFAAPTPKKPERAPAKKGIVTKPAKVKRSLLTDSLVLFGTASVLVIGGICLALAPQIGERAVQVRDKLDAFGIQSANVILGGFVFFALGFLSRGVSKIVKTLPDASTFKNLAQSRPAAPAPAPSAGTMDVDVGLMMEQLASDVAVLRANTQNIAGEVAALNQAQAVLLEQQKALASAQPRESGGGGQNQNQDAVFQLAAGLDKLHARIDQSIGQFAAHMEQRMAKVVEMVGKASAAPAASTKPAAKSSPKPTPKPTPKKAVEKKSEPAPPAATPAEPRFPETPTSGPFEEDDTTGLGELEVTVDLEDDFDAQPDAGGGSDLDSLLPDDAALRALQRERRRTG